MLATALLVAAAAGAQGAFAQEKVDLDMTGRIRAEAFQRSQVMATLAEFRQDPTALVLPLITRRNARDRPQG